MIKMVKQLETVGQNKNAWDHRQAIKVSVLHYLLHSSGFEGEKKQDHDILFTMRRESIVYSSAA
jgi:hypothetical protein